MWAGAFDTNFLVSGGRNQSSVLRRPTLKAEQLSFPQILQDDHGASLHCQGNTDIVPYTPGSFHGPETAPRGSKRPLNNAIHPLVADPRPASACMQNWITFSRQVNLFESQQRAQGFRWHSSNKTKTTVKDYINPVCKYMAQNQYNLLKPISPQLAVVYHDTGN